MVRDHVYGYIIYTPYCLEYKPSLSKCLPHLYAIDKLGSTANKCQALNRCWVSLLSAWHHCQRVMPTYSVKPVSSLTA